MRTAENLPFGDFIQHRLKQVLAENDAFLSNERAFGINRAGNARRVIQGRISGNLAGVERANAQFTLIFNGGED